MPSIDDVLILLGEVKTGIENLREDFQEEKRSAARSRAGIHARLDAQVEKIGDLEKDVGITAQINVQTREALKALAKKVDANQAEVQPSLEEWKRMRTLGLGLVSLLAIGGLSVGAALSYMGDGAVAIIRHWLRID